MKHSATILFTLLTLVACSSRNGKGIDTNETLESSLPDYADIVSFITKGYQCGWEGLDFREMGRISMAYLSCAPDYGFSETDINGDGTKELLIGKVLDEGAYHLFDIWTIHPADGSLIHLASGNDRDWYSINGAGVMIESIYDIRLSGPCQKGWQIEGAERAKVKVDAWDDDLKILQFEMFSDLLKQEPQGAVRAGGFSPMRAPTEEEIAMLKKAVADDGIIYTPLYVSTQVVAGTNHKFWCMWDDIKADLKDYKEPTEACGYCWISVFKPLPGRGEAQVTRTEKPFVE